MRFEDILFGQVIIVSVIMGSHLVEIRFMLGDGLGRMEVGCSAKGTRFIGVFRF